MLDNRKKNKVTTQVRNKVWKKKKKKNGKKESKEENQIETVEQKLGDIDSDGNGNDLKSRKKRKRLSEDTDGIEKKFSLPPKKRIAINEQRNESRSTLPSCEVALPANSPSIKTTPPTLLSISENYNIKSLNIKSASKIHAKVVQALEVLSSFPAIGAGAKHGLVLLEAKSNACCKMISIVEIIKRQIVQEMQGKWYQYNTLEQNLVKRKEIQTEKKDDTQLPNEDGVDTENFEIMKTPFERAIYGVPKVRLEPVMKIYLSRVRIEHLRKIYGEQTNGIM
ncbi:hypothetical protein HI914_03558 [Erysiphe necator]|nr:hypothetical protein HI914_03558 [Erysiphe necator]